MLTWVGFVGQLLDFVLAKIVGRHVDLALDERKRATRAFLDLYEAVDDVVDLAETFLTRLQPVVDGEKSRVFVAWLEPIADKLDGASRSFLQALIKVERVIAIYDRSLLLMLSNVRQSKSAILTGMSHFLADQMQFRITMSGKRLQAIEYTVPTSDAMHADFEETYRALEQQGNTWRDAPEQWPVHALAAFVRERTRTGSVTPTDVEAITALHKTIAEYLPVLAGARDHLGQFMRERFTLEDLLYVSRGRR
jgi:hypothetical protein